MRLVDEDRLSETDLNLKKQGRDKVEEWKRSHRNPLDVKGIVFMGHWRRHPSCNIKGYSTSSHGILHEMIDNHPKSVEGLGLVTVHESCTSKVCHYCGSLLVEQRINGKPYHHTTRCTSPYYKECSYQGRCVPRDVPASINIFDRGLKQICDLFQHDNSQQMTAQEKQAVYDKSQAEFLLFRKGRSFGK